MGQTEHDEKKDFLLACFPFFPRLHDSYFLGLCVIGMESIVDYLRDFVPFPRSLHVSHHKELIDLPFHLPIGWPRH